MKHGMLLLALGQMPPLIDGRATCRVVVPSLLHDPYLVYGRGVPEFHSDLADVSGCS